MKHTAHTVILIAAFAVAAGSAANELGREDWGVSDADREIEHFLRTAEIVKIEDIGEGITKPQRLTLELNGVKRRAIFKNVDIHRNEIAYTNRFETCFHDSYTYEVAAYRLDRLLHINLVPVTVLREVNGTPGSVQLWIEHATSLQKVVDAGGDCKKPEQLLQKLMLMYVLDAMIFNIDRNYGNVLVNADETIFYLIDHSRSFRNCKKLPKLQEARPIPIPQCVADGLRQIDQAAIDACLGDLLTKSQRKSIMKRRQKLVAELNQRSLLPDSRVAEASPAQGTDAG